MAQTFKVRFPLGARVRVSEGSGIDSGKSGVIIRPELNERGIPQVQGAYKAFRATGSMAERMIRLDNGVAITMFCSRLTRID